MPTTNPRILLMRMLGNDLEGLHGTSQTFTNLQFTLENEQSFPNVDRIFVLNRIVDRAKKNALIAVLNAHGVPYIDLPFDPVKLMEHGLPDIPELEDADTYKEEDLRSPAVVTMIRKESHTLYPHNLSAINNNGCRNFCVQYGRQRGYDWTFPLDSNSYFMTDDLQSVRSDLSRLHASGQPPPHYLVFFQARIKDGGMVNENLLHSSAAQRVRSLACEEPQVAFHRSAKILFDEAIPYGVSPKAEFIQRLGVPGKWQSWRAHLEFIKPHPLIPKHLTWIRRERAIRLHPHSIRNNIKTNRWNRLRGLYMLVKAVHRDAGTDGPVMCTGVTGCYASLPSPLTLTSLITKWNQMVIPRKRQYGGKRVYTTGPYYQTEDCVRTKTCDDTDRMIMQHAIDLLMQSYVQYRYIRIHGDRTSQQRMLDTKHRCEHLLSVYFINRETRMEPTPLACQRERSFGLIEFRDLVVVNECVSQMRSVLHPYVTQGYERWVRTFVTANDATYFAPELNAKNNHALSAIMLSASCAILLKEFTHINDLLHQFERALASQIDKDGILPQEVKRATSLHYTFFALELAVMCYRLFTSCCKSPALARCRTHIMRGIAFVCKNVNKWPYEKGRTGEEDLRRPWLNDVERLVPLCVLMGHKMPTLDRRTTIEYRTHHTGMLPGIIVTQAKK